MTLIPRQLYFGRVISPAKFYPAAGNRKPFITFVLAVNGLASVKEGDRYTRTSAKITCSYSIQSDNDMVATILSRISSDGNPQELGGQSYKSVYVGIEGSERLVQVTDSEGHNKGYYKNLDFCSVEILDSNIKDLYKAETKPEATEDPEPQQPQKPTLAPKSKVQVTKRVESAPVEEAPEAAAEESVAPVESGYTVGDVITDPTGEEYRYIGGDAAVISSWQKLVKEVPVQKAVPPFMKAAAPAKQKASAAPAKTKATPSVSQVLDDGDDLDKSNIFNAITQGKGLAV